MNLVPALAGRNNHSAAIYLATSSYNSLCLSSEPWSFVNVRNEGTDGFDAVSENMDKIPWEFLVCTLLPNPPQNLAEVRDSTVYSTIICAVLVDPFLTSLLEEEPAQLLWGHNNS